MEFLKNIASYLFTKAPGPKFGFYLLALIVVAVLVLISFGLRAYYTKKVNNGDYVYKKMFKKIPNQIVYFAIGFLFLIGLRYENIPYFAMRLWPILLGIGYLAFAGKQIYKYFKIYPKELENFESRPRQNTENRYTANKR